MLCRMREQVLSEALRSPIALCFIVHGMSERMNVKSGTRVQTNQMKMYIDPLFCC